MIFEVFIAATMWDLVLWVVPSHSLMIAQDYTAVQLGTPHCPSTELAPVKRLTFTVIVLLLFNDKRN